ncbi:hypothetical protein FHS85_004234 [Rhodoligotrophos appendicifer]|uniref:nuclear transport factor 2 family protein n=1 Tax=Rhodoligotrophos appendicifer TaxID=987056 RepID=UPI0011851C1B|nr:nuclear transport factor 2 family protein [Rhodoligotrophos appendicifer]
MAIKLPKAVAAYFEADGSRDAESVSQCFIDAAVVKDDGTTYSGREAIRSWKAATSTQYSYTVEPFSITSEGRHVVVTSHLVGDFPGSPIDLRYVFALEGEKIAELTIIP